MASIPYCVARLHCNGKSHVSSLRLCVAFFLLYLKTFFYNLAAVCFILFMYIFIIAAFLNILKHFFILTFFHIKKCVLKISSRTFETTERN